MEHIVNGCEDCPFFDSAGGEYDRWCNHPNRPIKVFEKVVTDKIEWLDVTEDEKGIVLEEYKERKQVMIFKGNKTYIVNEFDTKLYESKPYLDYPNWCPMIIEPIIVKAKFQVLT